MSMNKKEIQKLNKKYRGINKPTDVLSFSAAKNKNIFGDIIICKEIIEKYDLIE